MVARNFSRAASFPSVQTSMICCPMIDSFVVTDCLRGRLFLRAVQVVEVEGCQCRFGHNIVSAYSENT